jgi:hypothetical protein
MMLAGLGTGASAEAASVGRDLLAVSADSHAAPTAMVRFGVVGKPEHARVAFTVLHQLKVGGREQIGSSLRHGRENRLGGIFSPDLFDLQRASPVPHKPGMTLRAGKKFVEDRGISALSCLSFLDKRANILA